MASSYKRRQPLQDNKIMVVEDDEQGRLLIRMVLKKLGCQDIRMAKDGAEAWDAFNKETDSRPDLIISDWNMPGMTGFDLLEKVREVDYNLPFIMITGRGTADSVVAASSLDVSVYLHKPYTPQHLIEKIMSVLGISKV